MFAKADLRLNENLTADMTVGVNVFWGTHFCEQLYNAKYCT